MLPIVEHSPSGDFLGARRKAIRTGEACQGISQYAVKVLAALLPLVFMAILTVPVLAAISQPTDLDIQDAVVYENALESGDQCWFITYFIDFTTLPDENVDDLFIFRLLDTDDSEITATVAYPYYSQGYELGVVCFYLEASEAPTWQSDLTVEIYGNPLVDWDGDPPTTSTTGITWNTGATSDIQELIGAEIINLATELEQAWSVEMVESSGGITALSEAGSSYFLRVVPNLADIAPFVLGQYVFYPDYPADKPEGTTWADQLMSYTDGTVFDLSSHERRLGVPRGTINAVVYYGAVIAFFIWLSNKKGVNKGTMIPAWGCVVASIFFGVNIVVAILGAFLCLITTVWVFYKGSPA